MDSTDFTFKEKWQMVPIKRWNGKLIKQNKRIIKEYVTWKNLTLTLEVIYIYIYICMYTEDLQPKNVKEEMPWIIKYMYTEDLQPNNVKEKIKRLLFSFS